MPVPIVEVQIKPTANKLRLEWGMPVEEGTWVWQQPTLEVRLYCRPYPEFGKPDLLDMLETTHTGSGAFRIPFLDVTVGKEKTRSAFRPGTVAADPLGKFYPLHFDLSEAAVPAGGVICYPAVEWPVHNAWLDQPMSCWVVFGYTARGEFIPVHEEPPYEHIPEGAPAHPVLPDIPTIPYESRVRRRGASRRLFISYRHADIFAVNQIARRLSDEFYYDVWIDYDSIPGGARWQEEIALGIQSADRVLFMVTPGACASQWCQAEVAHALKHAKTVIPVRLTTEAEAKDLKQVGLDEHQWIDFATVHTEAAWQRLIESLPRVTEREYYWLKHPEAQRLHERYLKQFFKDKFMKVSLADMMDDPPERGVDLLDIYVPLPVDMSVTVQVSEEDHYTITDWWVKTERSETAADEATPEALRGQKLCEWPALKADQAALQILIDDVQRQLKERVADAEKSGFGAQQNWYMEAHDAASIQPRMVLTGNPGSGKSTFLKHLAICMAGDQLRRSRHVKADLSTLHFWPLHAYTPVFISLRDLVARQFPDPGDPAGTPQLEAYLKTALEADNLGDYWPHLQRQMDEGDVLLLLDGLDEVPDAVTGERREQIIAFVNALSVDYEDCRMIITSRPYAYNGTWQLAGFGQTALIPLFSHRIRELASMLFGQVIHEAEAVQQEAGEFIHNLERINDPNLSNTPLLFTMMAALWLRSTQLPPEQRLPQRLSQLYRACVDLMLRRWTYKDDAGRLSVAERLGLTPEQLRQALTLTAYHVQAEQGSDRQATFSQWGLVEAMEVARGARVEQYGDALDYLEQRAGLLTSEEARHYRFTHLSFQEHLAACYLSAPERFPADIRRHLREQPGRWTNVVPLLADEVAERGGALVKLVESLLDVSPTPGLSRDHPQWAMVGHANGLIGEYNLTLSPEHQQRLHEWAAAVITTGALPPIERAEMGRTLADLGDSRPGVLAPGGIPNIEWCEVPAGQFRMGGDPNALSAWDGAEYDLPCGFWIAKYPVTYAQYEPFVTAGGYQNQVYWTEAGWQWKENRSEPYYWNDPKWHIANHPVVGVSWYEAYAYTRWLNEQAIVRPGGAPGDYVFRLPRECEWEKAARYPDGRLFPWGNEFDGNRLNYSGNNIGRTTAVGIFPTGANPSHGACDLIGNVWEWLATEWQDQYNSPDAENNDPGGGAGRCLRGGSWGDGNLYFLRAAARSWLDPSLWDSSWGLRVILSVPVF